MTSIDRIIKVIRGVQLDKTIINEKYSKEYLRGLNKDALTELTIRIAVTPYGRFNRDPYVLILKRAKNRSEPGKLELPGGKLGYDNNNGMLNYESISHAARRELGTEIGYDDLVLQGNIGEADIVKKSKRYAGEEVDIRLLAIGSSLCYDAKKSVGEIPIVLNVAEHTNRYWMKFDEFANSNKLTDEMQVLIDNGMHFSKLAIDYDCSNCYRMIKIKNIEKQFHGLNLMLCPP